MAAPSAKSATFRFPGHPASLSRQSPRNVWGAAVGPHARATRVGKDLYEEVLANIHRIIAQGAQPR